MKVPPGELLGGQEKLSPGALEAARLFDTAAPEVQEAVAGLLRAVGKMRR